MRDLTPINYQLIDIPLKGSYRLVPEDELNMLISLLKSSNLLKSNGEGLRLGEVIINYRKLKNLNQKELALNAGLTIASVCNLEKGKIEKPRQKTLERLCESLGNDFQNMVTQLGYMKSAS